MGKSGKCWSFQFEVHESVLSTNAPCWLSHKIKKGRQPFKLPETPGARADLRPPSLECSLLLVNASQMRDTRSEQNAQVLAQTKQPQHITQSSEQRQRHSRFLSFTTYTYASGHLAFRPSAHRPYSTSASRPTCSMPGSICLPGSFSSMCLAFSSTAARSRSACNCWLERIFLR